MLTRCRRLRLRRVIEKSDGSQSIVLGISDGPSIAAASHLIATSWLRRLWMM